MFLACCSGADLDLDVELLKESLAALTQGQDQRWRDAFGSDAAVTDMEDTGTATGELTGDDAGEDGVEWATF